MVKNYSISLGPFSRGFHIITEEVKEAVAQWPENGLMHVFLRHTSAGLCINENVDYTVRDDFKLFFERLAPEDLPGVLHVMEGPDNMPAHIKSTLTGISVTIPIVDHRLDLGTWQGIYLCEFRNQARRREITISILD